MTCFSALYCFVEVHAGRIHCSLDDRVCLICYRTKMNSWKSKLHVLIFFPLVQENVHLFKIQKSGLKYRTLMYHCQETHLSIWILYQFLSSIDFPGSSLRGCSTSPAPPPTSHIKRMCWATISTAIKSSWKNQKSYM